VEVENLIESKNKSEDLFASLTKKSDNEKVEVNSKFSFIKSKKPQTNPPIMTNEETNQSNKKDSEKGKIIVYNLKYSILIL
jgi:hypothetical protein